MQRLIRYVVPGLSTLAICVLLLAACGGANASTSKRSSGDSEADQQSTVAKVRQRGYLRVGVVSDREGFSFRNKVTDKVEGFDVELGKNLAGAIFGKTPDKTANDVKFVNVTVGNRAEKLTDGEIDVALGAYDVTLDPGLVAFSKPYYVSHGDLLVRSNVGVSSASLAGQPICVVAGTDWAARLQALAPTIVPSVVDTYAQCEDAVSSGAVLAAVGDQVTLASLVQTGDESVQLAGLPFGDLMYGIAVAIGDSDFVAYIDSELSKMASDGRWAAAFGVSLGRFGLPPKIPEQLVA